jgi:hypothetical protein
MKAATLLPTSEVLGELALLLDRVDPTRGGLAPTARLELVRSVRLVRRRVEALEAVLIGEADKANASLLAAGTPLNSWLGQGEVLSRREASAAVSQARVVEEHPLVGEAAVAGRLGTGQVRAIGMVLGGLATQLSNEQQTAAEQVLVELAGHLDADQLAKAAPQVLAKIAPAEADELLETRLQREAEAAQAERSLRWFRERGSVRFEGSLPRVDGERFIALLGTHAEGLRRTAIGARDPLATATSAEQRRADALIALLNTVAAAKPAAGVGAVKVIVKLDYHRLRNDAAGAGLLSEGQPISAGELRRLCCDAEIIPTVLRGASEVLDVGRAERLVTPPIRTALTVRDVGCTFPGCNVEENLCEAHHIEPWWMGGVTALSNLTLLCHSHHGLVEPAKFGLRDQWHVEIAGDGLPQFIPPARLDPLRRPQRNHRHQRSAGVATADAVGGAARSASGGAARRISPPKGQAETLGGVGPPTAA